VDIVGALTDSPNPRDYWYRMKRREKDSSGVELSTLCRQLKLTSADGKSYTTEAVNTENAFRIIHSIPSPKAEPFKRWLAQVGYERVQEIENPELAQQRMKELYKEKGYPADWIEKRMRSVAIRDEPTDEWKQRGIKEQKDFAILTAEIRGVDVYDPTAGAIRSLSTDDIAWWFIDTNYNQESFFVRHAHFTGSDEPYEKSKRAL
jgi:DNA-damage-inducible protein D